MSSNKPSSAVSIPIKDQRDNDRMGGVAASMAMDASMNPGLADPTPTPISPPTQNQPVLTATGLANASQSLEHGLHTGGAAITPAVLKTTTNDAQDEAKHDEAKNDELEIDGLKIDGLKIDEAKQEAEEKEADKEKAPETMTEKVVHVASEVASAVKAAANDAVSAVTGALPTRVKDAASTAAEATSTVADAATNAIPDSVKDATTAIKDAATDAVSTATSTVKDVIPEVVKDKASKVGKSIDPAQVVDAEGSIPVSAVEADAKNKDTIV